MTLQFPVSTETQTSLMYLAHQGSRVQMCPASHFMNMSIIGASLNQASSPTSQVGLLSPSNDDNNSQHNS
jgi:hypothetical protein